MKLQEGLQMKLALTGGLGYIGRNFLAKSPLDVIHVFDKHTRSFVEDIKDLSDCDGIIHLAAISGIRQCETDKHQAYIDNVLGTINMMTLAYDYDIPMVFASSQAAKNPENSFYATSKWIGEQEAIRLNRKGANIKILRFSNVYGGSNWKNKTSVVASFRRAKEEGRPIIINGDGSQRRDFLHVYDLCDAIMMAVKCKEVYSQPIDIGTGISTSILEVAKMFDHPYDFVNSKLVGVSNNFADINAASEVLGFTAMRIISKGIIKKWMEYGQ